MPAAIYLLIGLLMGGLLGFAFGWLQGRHRAGAPDARLAGELRLQLNRRDQELAATQKQVLALRARMDRANLPP
jgi:hypothetical protein